MERSIGSTDLRVQLTDVLTAVREERKTYLIETFGRVQAALVNVDEYRQFQHFREAREDFFERLRRSADGNAMHNAGLSEADVMSIVASALEETADSGGAGAVG